MRSAILSLILATTASASTACAVTPSSGETESAGTATGGGLGDHASGDDSQGADVVAKAPDSMGTSPMNGTPGTGTGTGGGTSTTAYTKVVVHYPHSGKALSLSSDAQMGMTVMSDTGDTVTFKLSQVSTSATFAVTLDGAKALGGTWKVSANQTLDLYPRFFGTKGKAWQKQSGYTTKLLSGTRNIWVYTPPGYEENSAGRYPVLYMHDGDSLFNTNVAGGTGDLRIDEFLDAGAADGSIREIIVVGVGSNANRYSELTPPRTRSTGSDGLGDKYLDMIALEIKPAIDAQFRTLSDRANTGVMGESLGGLMSMEAALTHDETFGVIGAQSPSAWYDANILADQVKKWSTARKPNRLYIDCGDTSDMQADISQVVANMKTAGFVEGQNLHFTIDPQGKHEIPSWQRRLPDALHFMFGK